MWGTDADDAVLLQAAAMGDERAFATFYRRWLPSVTSYHLRRTRTRELAFDLTAETFAAVVADCARFDPERGSAPGWLFQIAEHKLLDSLRRARVESSARVRLGLEPMLLQDSDLERVEALASVGDANRLDQLLAQLPAEQRGAVRARVLEERSYAEIASELRCSEAVVRQRVHRGLSRLREWFQGDRMSAHDQLERQLLDSVARQRSRRWSRRSRPARWPRGLTALIAGVSCVAALGVAVVAIVSLHHRRPTSRPPITSGPVTVPARSVCNSNVLQGVLPAWARDGFSDPRPRMPHVLGASGSITAILWAYPLLSPPPRNHNNKILWVSRNAIKPGSDLRITAQRMTGEQAVGSPVTRTVIGGPGPSIINLPAPGCWRLTLRWSDRIDSLDLQYAANR